MNNRYLINPICEFEPLTPIDLTKKKNIVSFSFFKMENSYRDINQYVREFDQTYKDLKKVYTDYAFRMFIDLNIYEDKEIMDKLKKYDIDLILFKCSNFMQNKFHVGTFSMIVRFFPMFDFECNDANIVIISDVDLMAPKNIAGLSNLINYYKKKKQTDDLYFVKEGSMFKNSTFGQINKKMITAFTISPMMASFKRIDSNTILHYLDKLLKNDDNTDYSNYFVNRKESHKKFIYGFDEYFFNGVLINYFDKQQYPYSVRTEYQIYGTLYYHIVKTYQTYDTKENKMYLKKFVKRLLKHIGQKYDESKSVNVNYTPIDDIFYNKKNPKRLDLLFYLYKKIIMYYGNPHYLFLFPKSFYDIIFDKKYFGCIQFDGYLYFNSEFDDDYLIMEKFSDEQLAKLSDKHLQKIERNKIQQL